MPGTDQPFEYIELRRTTASLAGVYVVVLEGDGTGAGQVDLVANLSSVSVGSNGLLIIKSTTGGHPHRPRCDHTV